MKPKLKPPVSVGRIIFSHVILWPILHLILGLVSGGLWLVIGLPVQVIDLWIACSQRGAYAEARHEEMLEVIREGRNSLTDPS